MSKIKDQMERDHEQEMEQYYSFMKFVCDQNEVRKNDVTKEEEEDWDKKDPLDRLKAFLIAKKLWSDKEETKLVSQYKKEVDRQFEEAENYPAYELEDVFQFLYEEMPDDLKKQKFEHEKFLQWKETRK